jgi:hypothetical protein
MNAVIVAVLNKINRHAGHRRIEYESFKESILWRNSDLVVSCNMILIRLYLGQ